METFEEAPALQTLATALRPKLHRYCARMTGSRIDGEDVVQDALLKALAALPKTGSPANAEAWLFRIAHNASLDFLRRRARFAGGTSDDGLEAIAATDDVPDEVIEREAIVASSLRTFMRLPTVQRSSVILMDVLEYSLEEIGAIMDCSVPAVKSALHRGRARLREFAREPQDAPLPALRDPERSRLARYVDRFNARDFDAIREMLADDVRVELVNKKQLRGREATNYFTNYAGMSDWHFAAGEVDGLPVALVFDPADASRPIYFIAFDWADGRVATIRDFRYARYAADGL
ncbi:MAG TPA: sigma-70 family RNA polymerase sigma factor [Candidatus Acidoferrales bacterium]|jgi:RNA polymerase sigma-70 factor (ECF subfamily)|nr:sigma-70 family RNA polymerase sigma factor [Candidatus Acidoferrales bacterium]